MSKGAIRPDDYASNSEKEDDKYGLAFARYIESQQMINSGYGDRSSEWIENNSYRNGYNTSEKIKRLLLDGKDESYGKMSFELPIIIPKFYKTIKKNLSLELFESKVKAIDATSMNEHQAEKDKLTSKMINGEFKQQMSQFTGIDFTNKGFVPTSTEDRDVYLEVEHQLPQEVAMEQAITVVKEANYHDEILDKLADDLLTYGQCVVVDDYDPELGVVIKRVNPITFITSYDGSEMNDNRGSFFNGHMEEVSINDLQRIYNVPKEKMLAFANSNTRQEYITKLTNRSKWDDINSTMVQVLFFEFRTTFSDTYSIRTDEDNGKIKIKQRDDDYEFERDNVETVHNVKEVWMEGAWVVDSDIIMGYQIRNNQVIDSLKKVRSKYSSYDTDEMSTVRKMICHADSMALSMIKMNQMIAAARPKGLAINIASLMEVPSGADGSGENMSYMTLVDMYNDTGTQIFRQDEFTSGQGLPLMELENGLPRDFSHYMSIYNHNLQQLNIISGINEQMAGMGAAPRVSTESNEIALQSSIKSIEFVKDAVMSCEKRLSENIILRIQDIDEYDDKPFKKYVNALGSFNMRALMSLDSLHPFTFSLTVDMKPSLEERKALNEDLSISLQSGTITGADKIEVQAIKNLKLASLVLKRKIDQNMEKAQQMQLQQSEAAQQAQMQEIQMKAQQAQMEGQIELQKIDRKGFWDLEIEKLKLGAQMNQEAEKAQQSFMQDEKNKQHDNNKTVYNQGQMNQRSDKKLEAMAKSQLSKDSVKSMKK